MSLMRASELIENLRESRSIEVKRWIDPTSDVGKAKIVKGLFALINYNGGYLVVGFDNDTLRPDENNVPANVREAFHNDKIQEIVSHYASEPFDITVYYPERGGQEYPVITVPPGVRSPVATKRDLQEHQKFLIACDDVYFRTLQANNRVSSAKIPHRDWPELMRICFDNHEADIGRFLRRHLVGLTPDTVTGILQAVAAAEPKIAIKRQLDELLDTGETRYKELVVERLGQVPKFGSFEVGLIINGEVPPHTANKDFLRLLETNNPSLTGWPIWLNSQGFELENQPYIMDGGWEALIDCTSVGVFRHLEFMRKDPKGLFYLRRGLEDDLSQSKAAPKRFTSVDFGLTILRVSEAIAVGLSFAEALGCNREETMLEFAFRWKGLQGRNLSSWADSRRYIHAPDAAMQNEITCRTSILLDIPKNTISNYTSQIVEELFVLFGGYTISEDVIDDLVKRLLERKL